MRTKNEEYGSNSSLKFEADASVRQTVATPVYGIETQNILFGRISHYIIYTQTKFVQAEDGIRDRDGWLEFRRVLFRSTFNM